MIKAKTVFAQQVAVTFLSQGLTLIFSMAMAAITARWLGPVGKGEVVLTLMIPGVLQLVLGMGINVANVYYVGCRRIAVPKLTANGLVFALMGTVIGYLIVLSLIATQYLSVIVPGVRLHLLFIGLLALPIGLINANLSSLLLGLRHITSLSLIQATQASLTPILGILLIVWLQLGVLGAILATLGSNLAALLATIMLLRFKLGREWCKWDRQMVKPIMHYGLRAYVGNLLQFFNYRLDTFIVNAFVGPAALGIYTSSVTLAELLWQLPNSVALVFLPKAAATNSESMNKLTPKLVGIVLGMSILAALGLAIFGKIIIRILLSEAFADAYYPLLVLLPGVVFLGAAKIISSDIAGRGYPQYNSSISAASLVLTVLLDLILIPRIGIMGAALASSASYTLTFLLSIGLYLKVRQMPSQVNPS